MRFEWDGKNTYNVTLRRVPVTFVAVAKRWGLPILSVCVCVYRLNYPACNAHAPYCHLWPVRLYNIFPHYLINGTIFGKKLLNIKCVFWFSLQILSETFLILRRIQCDIIINVYRSSCKVPVILVRIEWKLKFLNVLKYQISWKSVQWEPSSSMRTDALTWRSE